MESFFRRLVGAISAKETGTEIIISGIDARSIERDITKHWKTSRITANLFTSVSRSELRIPKFFAPDFLYILESLKNYRSRYMSIKALAAIRAALYESTFLGKATAKVEKGEPGRLDFTKLDRLHFTPKDYQMEYFKDYTHRLDKWDLRGDLINASAGTGKTYLSMAIAEMLDSELIVVFCEKRAVELVWEDSVEEMYKEKQTVWTTFDKVPYKGERILVVHYAALVHFLDLVREGTFKGKRITTILDECHNMNDPKSLQTQLYLACVRELDSDNNLLASGTPVKALGSELITLMTVISRDFTPAVELRFRAMYGKEAAKGLDIIRARMGFMSFLIEKKELALEPPIMKPYPVKVPNGEMFTLPAIKVAMEKFIKERHVHYKARRPADDAYWALCIKMHEAKIFTGEQKKQYAEYLRCLKIVIKNPDPRYVGEEIKFTNKYEKEVFGPSLDPKMIHAFRDVKSVIKYTVLKIQGECLGRVLGGKRIECHVAMVPHIDWVGIVESTEKKTIIFTSFVEALEASETYVTKLGMKPLAVYGKTSGELTTIVGKFDKQPELNPLLATYASLATAVRLVMADTMLLMNSPFRSYILEQAVSRIYRLGQDSQCVVYQAALDTGDVPNISTRSADILAWSTAQVELITGVKSPFETKEAFENFNPEDLAIYDEFTLVHKMLQRSFEAYDIEISAAPFEPPKVKSSTPSWMRD